MRIILICMEVHTSLLYLTLYLSLTKRFASAENFETITMRKRVVEESGEGWRDLKASDRG